MLRQALAPGSSTLTFARFRDDEVIDQVAWQLTTGALRIAVKLEPRRSGGGKQSATPGGPASSPGASVTTSKGSPSVHAHPRRRLGPRAAARRPPLNRHPSRPPTPPPRPPSYVRRRIRSPIREVCR